MTKKVSIAQQRKLKAERQARWRANKKAGETSVMITARDARVLANLLQEFMTKNPGKLVNCSENTNLLIKLKTAKVEE